MTLKRIDRGRGHSYTLDGQPLDGVTKLISEGMPKPALINWAAKVTAEYAVDHFDELVELPPSQRLSTLMDARFAELDAASKRGTEVHHLAEDLAHGRAVVIPEELRGHVEAAAKFLDEWQPQVVATEVVVANKTLRYAGTLDLAMQVADGRRLVVDWKTARSGIWGETALQIGAYANAEVCIDAQGDEVPMSTLDLDTDEGLAVWIRADGYSAYPVDLVRGFKVFQHCAYLARQGRTLRECIGEEIFL